MNSRWRKCTYSNQTRIQQNQQEQLIDGLKALQQNLKSVHKIMLDNNEDKKLVKQYKKTNKVLRSQLEALNEQIDTLILQKTNKFGLQKLPKVQKELTDNKIIKHEVEIMRRRLEQVRHDNAEYKQKMSTDFLAESKRLEEDELKVISQKEDLKRKIKIYEKRLKEEKTEINLKREEDKLLQRIQEANEELIRAKKKERDLKLTISMQTIEDNKKTSNINDLNLERQELLRKSQLTATIDSPVKGGKIKKQQKSISPKGNQNESESKLEEQKSPLDDQEWEQFKQKYLVLKESTQQEEMYIYEENDRLRKELKKLNQDLKVKRSRVEVVKKYNSLEPEKRQFSSRLEKLNQRTSDNVPMRRKRGFSTIDDGVAKHHSVRYRDRNNSIAYDRY